MSKRANGEGTMSRRKDSNGKTIGWRAAVTIGENEDGSQKRRWVSGKSQEEVKDKLRALQSNLHQGLLSDTKRMTIAEFLKHWTDHKEREGIRPNTAQSYRDTVKRYIIPHLGRSQLEKLRPLDIEHLLTKLRQDGKSASMTAYTLRVLKMALQQGVRWQMLPRNVADAIKPPKVERREMQYWKPEEVVQFLDHTLEHRQHALFYLALMTGMRRGELLGLMWDDLDLQRSRLTVRHNLVEIQGEGVEGKMRKGKATVSSRKAVLGPLKSDASRRTLVLSKGTVEKLKEHRQLQVQERAMAADAWNEEGFVFASQFGGPTLPDHLSNIYQTLLTKIPVKAIRFHDLRHTAASLMIRKGVPPKTVSERLGHADVAFTLRVYVHLYDEQREEAAFDISDFALEPVLGPV